jgi:hypothetical protein
LINEPRQGIRRAGIDLFEEAWFRSKAPRWKGLGNAEYESLDVCVDKAGIVLA